MTKYESLKFLKETKARIAHICCSCGTEIRTGEIYYAESIGKVNAPGIRLEKYCYDCGKKLYKENTQPENP